MARDNLFSPGPCSSGIPKVGSFSQVFGPPQHAEACWGANGPKGPLTVEAKKLFETGALPDYATSAYPIVAYKQWLIGNMNGIIY